MLTVSSVTRSTAVRSTSTSVWEGPPPLSRLAQLREKDRDSKRLGATALCRPPAAAGYADSGLEAVGGLHGCRAVSRAQHCQLLFRGCCGCLPFSSGAPLLTPLSTLLSPLSTPHSSLRSPRVLILIIARAVRRLPAVLRASASTVMTSPLRQRLLSRCLLALLLLLLALLLSVARLSPLRSPQSL
jgi:hypothetical protein